MRYVVSHGLVENIFEMFACVPDELDPDTYYMEHAPYIQCYTYDRRPGCKCWLVGGLVLSMNAARVICATLITVP